jgi:predicted nucleotidyltransferase
MCQALRALDPGLRRVILVGSSVYGPEMARDIDLVVVSRRPLAPSAYAAAVEGFAPDGRPVDVIPLREGAPLGNLRLAVASGVCLLDDGSGPEASGVATLADFAEARSWLTTASTMIDVAMAQQGEQATRFAQEAFQALFHGARTAAMALLGMTEHRWGEARRELPAPLRGQFSMIIDNCHIRYGYEARFPPKPEAVRALFTQWKGRVETFIAGAEAEAIRRQPPNV